MTWISSLAWVSLMVWVLFIICILFFGVMSGNREKDFVKRWFLNAHFAEVNARVSEGDQHICHLVSVGHRRAQAPRLGRRFDPEMRFDDLLRLEELKIILQTYL